MIFDFFKPQVEKPEELDLKFTAETLKKNAVSGVVVLAVRRISVQLIQTLSSTIFWTVLLVSVLFFLMLWMIAPQVANFYKLKVENGLTLTRLMALAIFLINIRMISLAILERQIRYLRLSIIEGGELLIIQTLAVLMAIKGFQIESLVVSYLVGKSLGTLAFYILSPFKLALGFAKDSLAKFLGFALNYQVYSLAYA